MVTRERISRVYVWSAPLRLVHWLLAGCTIVLLASGWLMVRGAGALGIPVQGVHANTGWVLLAALGLRLYLLLLGRGPAQWRDLVPLSAQGRAAARMLRFYLSLGRTALPGYYAHNPLWGPLYLLLFALLAAQGVSAVAGWDDWHRTGGALIGALSALHVLAVFLHDWKGTGSEVSAMISGYKIFLVLPPPPQGGPAVELSLGSGGRTHSPGKGPGAGD